jgi:predicted dinucleotide-binding enzyme
MKIGFVGTGFIGNAYAKDFRYNREYILQGLRGEDRRLVKDALQRAEKIGCDIGELFRTKKTILENS